MNGRISEGKQKICDICSKEIKNTKKKDWMGIPTFRGAILSAPFWEYIYIHTKCFIKEHNKHYKHKLKWLSTQ